MLTILALVAAALFLAALYRGKTDRILETRNGIFCPQYRRNWLSLWKFYHSDALSAMESGLMLERVILTPNYAESAKFNTKKEAEAFMQKAKSIAREYHSRNS